MLKIEGQLVLATQGTDVVLPCEGGYVKRRINKKSFLVQDVDGKVLAVLDYDNTVKEVKACTKKSKVG